MGDHIYRNQTGSRFGLRGRGGGGGGQIVEVEGGHIIRSTGRKDRHSKVCTAKGPRDRRVRLAAHTAIQFYDVQDRLGYDRPSKAVDWLIKKAKTAIDELEKLPAWKPSAGLPADEQEQIQKESEENDVIVGNEGSSISFLPPSMVSDSIADTIKSFFPMGASNNSSMPDLLSRSHSHSHSQDLKLSLQSFQDPIMLHHHQNPTSHNEQESLQAQENAVFFSGTTPVQLGFDGLGWSDYHQQQPTEPGRFQRFTSWNPTANGGDATAAAGEGEGEGEGGYLFNTAPLQPFFGQNQFFSQRGPLQSSYTPPVRAWIEPSAIAMPNTHDHHHHQAMLLNYPQSLSGISGFSGFPIPARIQGDEEEEHDSASSDSYR